MRKGSSLTELLIVIVILSCLVAILAPVFATAQGETGTQKCQAHGMKIGAAMLAYMADNDGRFPSSATPSELGRYSYITWRYQWPAGKPGVTYTWGVGGSNQFAYIQLAKYVKDKETWVCPAPTTPYAQKYAYGFRCSWFFLAGWQAGMPQYLPYPDTGFTDSMGAGRTLTDVLAKDLTDYGRQVTPSQKVWACCYSLGDMIPMEAYSGGPVITPSYAHGEGTVYLYADGHAVWRETGRGYMPVHYTNHPYDEPHEHS